MPEISRFYGIRILMYFDEHNPPHFHAEYNSYNATFDMDGNITEGELPRTQKRLVKAWLELHSLEILQNWEAARLGEELTSIRGLK